MISKQALDLQTAQVQTKARAYFDAMFNRPDIKGLKVTFSLRTNGPGDFTVLADGSGKIDRLRQAARRAADAVQDHRAGPLGLSQPRAGARAR